jgi:hypothetical protein
MSRYYSPGSNSIGLLTQHPQYTTIPSHAVSKIHTDDTDTRAVPSRTHNFTCVYSNVSFYVSFSNDMLQYYGFGKGYIGKYSTKIKLFWFKANRYCYILIYAKCAHTHTEY